MGETEHVLIGKNRQKGKHIHRSSRCKQGSLKVHKVQVRSPHELKGKWGKGPNGGEVALYIEPPPIIIEGKKKKNRVPKK